MWYRQHSGSFEWNNIQRPLNQTKFKSGSWFPGFFPSEIWKLATLARPISTQVLLRVLWKTGPQAGGRSPQEGFTLKFLSLIDRDLQSAIRVTVHLISMFELLGPSSWVSKTQMQPNYQTKLMMWIVCFCLRVEFLSKTDNGYPRDAGIFFHSRWQTLGVPFALTPIGQLHQSQPSPVPGNLGRCHSHQSQVTRT